MDDTPGLGRPQQDDDQLSHTLTVHEVGERLAAAGVPRSERQIKRYCESAFLDAKKIPGPTGDQWFMAPAALPKLIGDLQQWQMQRAGHSQSRPAVTDTVSPQETNTTNTDTPGTGRPQPAVTVPQNIGEPDVSVPDTSRYVTQLETRIDEKDDVIGLAENPSTAFSHERDVGVKWKVQRGWRASQRCTSGVLCAAQLLRIAWTTVPAGISRSSALRRWDVSTPMALHALAEDRALETIERREQPRGAVALL